MANNAAEAAAAVETTNALTADPAEALMGFSTKDGERQEPAKADEGKGAKAAAAKAAGGKAPEKKADEAATAEDDGDDAEAQQRHKSVQQRINKAVGAQRAAERERDALRDRMTSLEARLAAYEAVQGTGKGGKPAAGGDEPPNPDDFDAGDIDPAYIRALARYETKKAIEESRDQDTGKQLTREQQQKQAEFARAVDDFKQKGYDLGFDDFEEVVFDDNLKISEPLAMLLLESDHGPKIAYELASDPKEARRISALSPARQAAWFGQQEAALSAESEAADDPGETPASSSPKTTQAPPPPRKRANGSGSSQPVTAATTDFAAFEQMAMAKK